MIVTIFLTQINAYTEIMHSEIIQTHPPNVPRSAPAGFPHLRSDESFSHNLIDRRGYSFRAVFVPTSVPERKKKTKKTSVQFRHSSHEIGLYQIGIYVNEYCQEMSRRCIPKKLSFVRHFQENKTSAGKAAQTPHILKRWKIARAGKMRPWVGVLAIHAQGPEFKSSAEPISKA